MPLYRHSQSGPLTDLWPIWRPGHSNGSQRAYSRHRIPHTDPAIWENRPHSRCRQTRFLPSPSGTLRYLSVIAVLVEVSRYPIRPTSLNSITMPSVSLIPDRQLTFSPELAETIGLEEAVLLQALGEQLADREAWTAISLARLQATLSFWSVDHIADLIGKLVNLGILQQKPSQTPGSVLLSAAADTSASNGTASCPAAELRPTEGGRWQPSAALEDLIALTHGIPRHKVLATQCRCCGPTKASTSTRQSCVREILAPVRAFLPGDLSPFELLSAHG